MGNDVSSICVSTKKPNQANQANQTQPIQQQSDNAVFKLPTNLNPGDMIVVNNPDGSQTVCSAIKNETVNNEGTSDDAVKTTCAVVNQPTYNFGSLTTGSDMSCPDIATYDFTAGLSEMLNKLNSQQAAIPEAAPQAGTETTSAPSGNNIYDIAFQKALEKLTKKLDEGKITEKEFITQLKELKKDLKNSALQEVKEDRAAEEADVNEQRDKKLTAPQKDALKRFLSNSGNKTFSPEDFKPDSEVSGAQTATQNMGNIVRTVKVLNDGTRIEITEDKSKEGFEGVLKGKRKGFLNGLVGTGEIALGAITTAAGIAISALGHPWAGVPMIIAGASGVGDGGRRLGNSVNGSTAFTAVITKPDNTKQTIQSNKREDFDNQIYKNLGILK